MISKHYIWLLAISFLAAWQVLHINNWPNNILAVIHYLPYVVIVFGIFISVFLNRFLPILLLAFILLLNLTIAHYLPSSVNINLSSLSSIVLLAILSLLLPINIILWSFLPEKGVKNIAYNLFLSSLFLSQIVIIYYVMYFLPINFIEFLGNKAILQYTTIPVIAVVLIIVSWLLIVAKNSYLGNVKVLDETIIFVLLLIVFALHSVDIPFVFTWLSAIAALLIVIAIIFDSHKIAYTDQLTGLASRRAMFESFLSLGKKYSIAMMDIDHFKKFNDTYGHDVGDKVLIAVAHELSRISVGKVYRYGGEEFTIIFARKTALQVEQALEQVRINIENLDLNITKKGTKNTKQHVTVSFGLSEKTIKHKHPTDVMKIADEALYKAKKAGRNKIVII